MVNVFWIRARRHNIGNEAIAVALHRMLRAELDGSVNLIPVATIRAEEDGWLSGLGARSVHEMNLYGHGVVVGGGNLYENGRLDVDVHALRCLRPPLLVCSVSHGRIYDERGQLKARTDAMPDAVIRALGEQASHSVARDDATLAHLRRLGLDRAVLGGCPTLFLDETLRRTDGRAGESGGALLSIRNPQLMSVPLAHQARVASDVLSIAAELEREGLGPVRLLCHDKRDMAFAASLGNVDYVLPDDVDAYFGLLREAPLVVAFRLHAFVPCLSLGVPAINVSYDERSLSLVRTIGLEEWDINLLGEPNVTGAVLDRVGRLDDLHRLRENAAPIWWRLEETLRGALRGFAEEVRAYAMETVLHGASQAASAQVPQPAKGAT
jgi:hypothetical protein